MVEYSKSYINWLKSGDYAARKELERSPAAREALRQAGGAPGPSGGSPQPSGSSPGGRSSDSSGATATPGVPLDPAFRRELELQKAQEQEKRREEVPLDPALRREEELQKVKEEKTTTVTLPPLDPGLRRELEVNKQDLAGVEDPALRREAELASKVTPLQERGGTLKIIKPEAPPVGSDEWVKQEIEKRGVPVIPDEKIGWDEKALLGGLVLSEWVKGRSELPIMSTAEKLSLILPVSTPLRRSAGEKTLAGIRYGAGELLGGLYVTGYAGLQVGKRSPKLAKKADIWLWELGYYPDEALQKIKKIGFEVASDLWSLGSGIAHGAWDNPGYAAVMLTPVGVARELRAAKTEAKAPEPLVVGKGDILEADVLSRVDLYVTETYRSHPTKPGVHEKIMTIRGEPKMKSMLVPGDVEPAKTFVGEMWGRDILSINADPWRAPGEPYFKDFLGVEEFMVPKKKDVAILHEEMPSPPRGETQYLHRSFRVTIEPMARSRQKQPELFEAWGFKGEKIPTYEVDPLGQLREKKPSNPWREEKINELVEIERKMNEDIYMRIDELNELGRRRSGDLFAGELVRTEEPVVVRTRPRGRRTSKRGKRARGSGGDLLGTGIAMGEIGAGFEDYSSGRFDIPQLEIMEKPQEQKRSPEFQPPGEEEVVWDFPPKQGADEKLGEEEGEGFGVAVGPRLDVREDVVTRLDLDLDLDIPAWVPESTRKEFPTRIPRMVPPSRRGFFRLSERFDWWGSRYKEIENPIATAEEFLLGTFKAKKKGKKKKGGDIFDIDFEF